MEEQNVKSDTQSMYCYPGTTILKNKLNIKDKELLDTCDKMLSVYKLTNLINGDYPFPLTLNVEHYLNIHKYLFGELYEFAGEIRKEVINKKNEQEHIGESGIRIYCQPNLIYDCLNQQLLKMKNDARNIYTREGLLRFLSQNYLELYFIHPFREGNSRTLREFMREYVEVMNKLIIRFGDFSLNYSYLDNSDNENFIRATIWNISSDSEKQKQSIQLLYNCFDKCLIDKSLVEIQEIESLDRKKR